MKDKPQDINLAFFGKELVGKTSFIKRWINNEALQHQYDATVGIDFFSKIDRDKSLHYKCWDFAGQKRFRGFTKLYLKHYDIVVFMFDVTNADSLNELSEFISEFKTAGIDAARFILVANKIDKNRLITYEQAREFGQQHGIENYVALSVKTGEGMGLLQQGIESFALSLKPKPNIAQTLHSALGAKIETLEKLYTENPRRGGRVAVQAITNILKNGAVAQDAQTYFDDHLAELKQHFNTLQLTWRSVVNTVLNVVLSALITLTVVGLPLLYCFNLWKPNTDSLQHSFRFLTFGDKQQAEKVCHDVMVEQDVKLSF